ncbi:twin-arginine translocase subunit TatC [Desulfobulbus alkaliphilus]|uniref:twin-arginine translocase subunit TatC n=1 Tax=Desulfobulbus alkaliphilus TaxID=869814 RepID=UPI001963F018|nr:twin-arginine translocase subunit TatC [Desulfobulbus alkaliphilus]MBM9536867.1 twin-arginine translocase subunit TatC [Desulfobulbus alkaliphilus]
MHEFGKSIIIFLDELRRSIKWLAFLVVAVTAALFLVSGDLLAFFRDHLDEKLHFFTVAGPFLAHVKVALFAALYLLMPLCMFILWKALGKPFAVTGKRLFVYVFFTCLLFYSGTLFCYLVTLPFGIKFLLSFQTEDLQAIISISRFVNFVTLFILAFGLVFELPVFMVFTVQVKLLTKRFYEKNRRYAILAIAILAAMLTPTPDVFNMALMGVPLYFLYEAGILLIRFLLPDTSASVAGDQGP